MSYWINIPLDILYLQLRYLDTVDEVYRMACDDYLYEKLCID